MKPPLPSAVGGWGCLAWTIVLVAFVWAAWPIVPWVGFFLLAWISTWDVHFWWTLKMIALCIGILIPLLFVGAFVADWFGWLDTKQTDDDPYKQFRGDNGGEPTKDTRPDSHPEKPDRGRPSDEDPGLGPESGVKPADYPGLASFLEPEESVVGVCPVTALLCGSSLLALTTRALRSFNIREDGTTYPITTVPFPEMAALQRGRQRPWLTTDDLHSLEVHLRSTDVIKFKSRFRELPQLANELEARIRRENDWRALEARLSAARRCSQAMEDGVLTWAEFERLREGAFRAEESEGDRLICEMSDLLNKHQRGELVEMEFQRRKREALSQPGVAGAKRLY